MNKIKCSEARITATAQTLKSGEKLVADNNTVMHNKRLTFTCDLNGENFDGIIRIGHGKKEYSAAYLEITSEKIAVYQHYVDTMLSANNTHELKLKGFISVAINVEYGKADIFIMTAGGEYALKNVAWYGRNGDIYVEAEGMELSNVKLNWLSTDYSKPIYIFGDSYLNALSPERWVYYLHNNGFDNCFMTGYPGMGVQRGIVDFRLSIERGRPEYAVWLLGMNNRDSDDKINPDWLATISEFCETCMVRGITPILSTIPSTPKVNNAFKNEWVRSSGHRYIDLDRAVGTNVDLNWYDGMLADDMIHPKALGAKAIYFQMLVDLPEIMQ